MELKTLQEMEEIVRNNLNDIQLGLGKEEEERALKVIELLSKQIELHQRSASECYDKQERRRIDEEKNKMQAENEVAKMELTWKKMLFEMAKVLLPTGLSVVAYHVFQKRLLEFEETGRLTSSASRGLNLPKFWK